MEKMLKRANTEMAQKHLTDGEEISYAEAEELIKNPETFAQRIETSEEEIQPGLILAQETVELGDGHFTNKYDIRFNADSGAQVNIVTGSDFFYQHRLFHPLNRHAARYGVPAAVINGPFFFLQDERLENVPAELMYNLNIRDGKVVGLPSTQREALITNHEGKLIAHELPATGTLKIGEQTILWEGGEPVAHGTTDVSAYEGTPLLFNSACCTIEYDDPNDKKSLRRLRKELNTTPERAGVCDIVVNIDPANGELYVSKKNAGGGSDFFTGTFIIQAPNAVAEAIAVGSPVEPIDVGGFEIEHIRSAITVGPSVHHFLESDDHAVNHDRSLGSFPPFAPGFRYARSVAYEDSEGFTHFVVFDAVPRSEHMKGVTPKEVAEHIPADAAWAVFLDGGQSSRITYVTDAEHGDVDARGNQQYLRLHEKHKSGQGLLAEGGEHQYLWSRSGRPVPSVVSVHLPK